MPSNLIGLILDVFFEMHRKAGDYIYSFYVNYSRIILDGMHSLLGKSFDILLVIAVILATFYIIMALAVIFKKKAKENKLKHGSEPPVTVQIPTYNEIAAIACAKKCLEFDYPKEKVQIIIGDDSNNPIISSKIDEFVKESNQDANNNILVTRRGNNIGFKPGNLNYMLKFTNGEYIVIFDSDFLPEKDFLRRIIAPFTKDQDIAVVQARWDLYNFNQNAYSILGGTISLICHYVGLPFISWFGGNTFLCGSAEAIRKRDLEMLGGWRNGSLTEDIECSFRLIKEGKKLVYLEDLECKGEAPHTFKDLCKQQMRWAYGVISALKLHFIGILRSRKTAKRDKIGVLIFASGYLFSFLLLAMTITGTLSVISARPESINWALFLSETMRNIMITSGFVITSIIALGLGKKIEQTPRMIAASLSVGLVVTYYVNIGILKALCSRDMHWFMLNKNGNKAIE